MSFSAIAWAIEQGRDLKLPTGERMLLVAIADRMNGDKPCHAGQACLASDTGLTVRWVRDLTEKLEQRGLIHAKRVGRFIHYSVVRCTQEPSSSDTPEPSSPKEEPNSPIRQEHSSGNGHDTGSQTPQQRNSVPLKPELSSDQPIKNQENQDARVPAREGKVLDSGKEATAPPPAPPTEAQPAGTTDGFNNWLDSGAPASMHCATDAEEVTEDDTPQTKPDLERMAAQVEALAHELGQSKRRFAIPPGPQFTRWEQTEILASKRQWKQPTPEQLQAMYRAQGLHRGVP